VDRAAKAKSAAAVAQLLTTALAKFAAADNETRQKVAEVAEQFGLHWKVGTC
jgi:hypothetical protein